MKKIPIVTSLEFFEAIYKRKKVDRFKCTRPSFRKRQPKGSPTRSQDWRLFNQILRGRNRFIKVKDSDIFWEGQRTCKVRFLVEDGVLVYPRFEIRKVRV